MSNNTTDISDTDDTILTISDSESNSDNNSKYSRNETFDEESHIDNNNDSNIRKILNSQQQIDEKRRRKRKLSQDSNTSSIADLFNKPIKKLNFQKSSKINTYNKKRNTQDQNKNKDNDVNLIDDQHALNTREEFSNHSNAETWIDQSCPTSISDLCIHKKKLQDLESELDKLINKKTADKILIVSGPSGSGKSTSAKLIAQKLMFEKLTRSKGNVEVDINNLIIEFNILKYSNFENSSVNYFTEFLDQCKLLTGINEKCIIIEELPNLFHKETRNEFQNSILNWIKMNDEFQLPPLVFCISEYDMNNDNNDNGRFNNFNNFTIDNTFKVETVFGFNILRFENNGIKRIRFNKVAKTFLKKAISRVCVLQSIPSNKTINLKINKLSELGDLRNAINQFEFWYRFQYNNDQNMIEIDGKESNIDVFHSIGKLIYGSKHEELEFEDFQKRYNLTNRPIPKLNTQLITIDKINLEVFPNLTNFNLCILENYSILNPKVGKELGGLLEHLSLTDTLIRRSGDTNIHSDLSFISCLNIRIHCEKLKNNAKDPKNRTQIKFSRDSKLNKKKFRISKELKQFQNIRYSVLNKMKQFNYLNLDCLNLIDGFYLFKNLNSFKFKYNYYLNNNQTLNIKEYRTGGMFSNSLYADDEFIVDYDIDNNNNDDDDGDDQEMICGILNLKKIMRIYYGVIGNDYDDDDDDDNDLENDNNGFEVNGELSSDPIEDSEDEITNKNVSNNNNSDSYEFSDDSIELAVT